MGNTLSNLGKNVSEIYSILYCVACNDSGADKGDHDFFGCCTCPRRLCCTGNRFDGDHCLGKIGPSLEWHCNREGRVAYRCNECVRSRGSLPEQVQIPWSSVVTFYDENDVSDEDSAVKKDDVSLGANRTEVAGQIEEDRLNGICAIFEGTKLYKSHQLGATLRRETGFAV